MNRMRKIVGVVGLLGITGITAVIIFSMRGNQNRVPPPAEIQLSATPQEPLAVPTIPPTKHVEIPPDDGGGVITFATYSFLDDAYEPVLEEFHRQYPEITVQVRELPATLDTRLIASTADTTILMFRSPDSENHFLDLSPLVEGDHAFEPGSFWPGILDACQDAEGRVYGLPVFTEPVGIYYQKKAFDAAGLPHPKPGWTWEDFQKAVNTLARTENELPVYGFADDSFMDTPDETLLSPRISYLLDQTGGSVDVDLFDGELQWYLDLVKSGMLYSENIYPQQSPVLTPENTEAWSKAWNVTWKVSHEMFLKNPPAMWKGRLDHIYWGNLKMEALPNGSLNMSATADRLIESNQGIGWAPFPISADGKNDHTTPNIVTCAVISAGTLHPRSSWTWLNFLAAHPILPEWSLAVPSQPSVAEASAYWFKIPEELRDAARFASEHGWYSNQYPGAVLAVNQALLKAVVEKTDLKTALEEASLQVETAIQPTPDNTTIVVAPPEPTVVPSETTIEYFSLYRSSEDKLKILAEAFHRLHPEITVQVDSSGAPGAANLADTYDCFTWLPERDLPESLLIDLDQLLSKEEMVVKDDFKPQELAEYSQDGMLFGLPTAYRPNLIYYNADLLAERGLTPPAADWTFTDFVELINTVASSGTAEPVYGFALEYPTADIELFLAGLDVRLVDSTGDAPVYLFNTPETRDAIAWLADQVKYGVIFPITPFAIGNHPDNFTTVRQLILDGRVALWISWFDQDQGGSYSLQDASFTIGTASIPLPAGAVDWRPNQLALGQYISRRAENPRACWDWIKFLSEQPDSSLGIPARRSIRESESWVAQVGPDIAKVYQAAIEQRRLLSQENVYSLGPIRDWWNELLAESLSGADPIPLLAELQIKADAYTSCLAGSSDYQAGNAQQKTQAENACVVQANP